MKYYVEVEVGCEWIQLNEAGYFVSPLHANWTMSMDYPDYHFRVVPLAQSTEHASSP